MSKWIGSKLGALTLVALALIWALTVIEGKVQERASTRDAAVQGIAAQFAADQVWSGPVLRVQCSVKVTDKILDDKGNEKPLLVERDCSHTVRPKSLTLQGDLDVSERYRGIYKARVYAAKLALNANLPDWTPPPGAKIKAALVFAVSDPRGIKQVTVRLDGKLLEALPGSLDEKQPGGFHMDVPPEFISYSHALEALVELAGSSSLSFQPVAEQNDIALRSAWPHPSFRGQFLPDQRSVDGQGFAASWHVNDFATGGSLQATHAFGVSLIDPVNAYSQTTRAVVYGFLFVVLTLGGFFVFEKLQGIGLHPMQYLLVGLAVVIFFLLLLALSEHLAFHLAYGVAATACTGMIAAYSRVLMQSLQLAALIAAAYSLLYVGLYLMLASEDFALLLGAWLIFALLGITMFLTRKIDWQRTAM